MGLGQLLHQPAEGALAVYLADRAKSAMQPRLETFLVETSTVPACTQPCAAPPMTGRRWSNCAATSARPTLANKRVQANTAGQVALKLKTPWRDGTTHLVMSPQAGQRCRLR